MTRKELLTVDTLINDFGIKSKLMKKVVYLLNAFLVDSKNSNTINSYNEWFNYFSKIYGFTEYKFAKLQKAYDFIGNGNSKLFFSIQTYYSMILKFIAAELSIRLVVQSKFNSNYKKVKLNCNNINQSKEFILAIENGSFFLDSIKVQEFSQLNVFSWYLDEVDSKLTSIIIEIFNTLSKYDFITTEKGMCYSEDICKAFYQNLIPKEIRHNLGEYYTPDWLVDFTFQKINLNMDTILELRIIDPACGSGTFLIRLINIIRQSKDIVDKRSIILNHVLKNIVGIDLNPLAILAAKINYLLSMGDLLNLNNIIKFPIIQDDTILMSKNDYEILKQPFDLVIGNPPWILWDNLPIEYRNQTKVFWEEYQLFTLTGRQARYGGSKKEFSVLFLYISCDKFLKDEGRLAFIITQSIYKTKGSGEPFRKLRYKDTYLQLLEVHDLVEVKPFEGANNRTTLAIIIKGRQTHFPIDYIKWYKKDKILNETFLNVQSKLFKKSLLAIPSDNTNSLSPWITAEKNELKIYDKIKGKNHYRAYAGYNSGGANGVYWIKPVRIVESHDEHQLVQIENLIKGAKRKVPKTNAIIEDTLIYPLIKTRNVRKWKIDGYIYAIQPQNSDKRIGINEEWMINNLPKTYSYLSGFKEILEERAAFKKYMKGRKEAPFYSIYNVGEYTFSPHKVVWNQFGSELRSVVISKIDDAILKSPKTILPEHVLAFTPTEFKEEAHYICAIMNSTIISNLLNSIAGGTKSFGTPRIIEDTIKISRYDKNNKIHLELASLSIDAHQNVENIDKLKEIEIKINQTVLELYQIF